MLQLGTRSERIIEFDASPPVKLFRIHSRDLRLETGGLVDLLTWRGLSGLKQN